MTSLRLRNLTHSSRSLREVVYLTVMAVWPDLKDSKLSPCTPRMQESRGHWMPHKKALVWAVGVEG